jgi:hypothetical protein
MVPARRRAVGFAAGLVNVLKSSGDPVLVEDAATTGRLIRTVWRRDEDGDAKHAEGSD